MSSIDKAAVEAAFSRLYAGLRPVTVQAADAAAELGTLLVEFLENLSQAVQKPAPESHDEGPGA